MKKKMVNSDMPIGKLSKVEDFLPPPAELAVPEETTKITIALNKSSVEFFRRQANRHHTKYQRMIRELLDKYAMQYARS
ncbi:MAG: CopG family transcriptional regulator [Candidatus Omnitrophica bacterium]|nr:CopG family transcriptional regulator [Candidatus Omnitrophota bacterium]MBU1906259.1 CopG family transcriptional regulator [Candidatus Omnitrophota bacterium]